MSDAYQLNGQQWQNRIIGHDVVDADQLLANPLNFRIHSKLQQDAIAGSLSELGWVKSVTVNTLTGHIVDGHARVTLALRAGEPVPVEYVELTEAEENLALASLDYIVGMAATDRAKLDALIKDVQTGDEALMGMLAGMADEAGLYFGDNEPPEAGDAEPQTSRAEELRKEWGVEAGQLWRLPSRTPGQEHRLICGDCTDAAVVERVMGDERANLFFTDPPYGVSYADKNAWLNAVAFGNRIQTPIENDHSDIADIARDVWLPAFSLALECCCDTASFYLFMPQGGDQMMMMMMMMNDAGWMPRHELIWLKNNHVLGRADYNYKHEPILYGWKRKGTHKFYGDFQTSVFEVPKPQNSDLHPTMKPVELLQWLMPNNTQNGEICYDPFSGSGTTIIAAENLARQCRAVEIAPGYVAVALQRYQDAFGITPELMD